MPGFNVEVFKSEISKRNGIMRNNKFLMSFVPPAISTGALNNTIQTLGPNGGIITEQITADISSIGRSVEYWCEAVTLPGYQLATGDTRRWTYGPNEKRPFGPNVLPVQTLFLSDGNGDMFKFFHSWMNNIIPHYVSSSFPYPQPDSPGMDPYEVRYKSEYVTDLHIYVYGEHASSNDPKEADREILHYVLREAFPSHITDVPMAWADTNTHMKFQVIFDYLDWYMERIQVKRVVQQ